MTIHKHISTYILRVSVSILLFYIGIAVQAQPKKLPFKAKSDSVAFFNGVTLSVDLIGIGQNLLSNEGQYEASLRANLKDKYFPIIELGYGKSDTKGDENKILYSTKAPYGRIGIDFNVMKNKHDIYRVFVGGRYGFSSFKYNIEAPGVVDPVFGGIVPFGANNISGSYHWIEAVFGLDAHIVGPLRAGWSVRYKNRLAKKVGSIGEPYYVPGYGRGGSSTFGGTFYVAIELLNKTKKGKK